MNNWQWTINNYRFSGYDLETVLSRAWHHNATFPTHSGKNFPSFPRRG